MKNFSEFNIKPKVNAFVGEKIQLQRILNLRVTVVAFKIEPSKKKAGTNLLTLQIEKHDGEKRIVFTGSNVLIDQIERVPKDCFPFETVIKKDNEFYEFT